MAGAEKFLEAYVELSVRGMEKVDEAMRQVEDRVRGVGSGGRSSRSDEERIRDADERKRQRAEEQARRDRGREVEFDLKARAKLEKDMEDAHYRAWQQEKKEKEKLVKEEAKWKADSLKEEKKAREDSSKTWLDLFSGGAPPRRVISNMFSGMLGEGAGADAFAGIAGLIFGGIFLRLGWMLSSFLTSIPGSIGKEQSAAARSRGGILTDKDKAAYDIFEYKTRRYWAGTEEGWAAMRQGAELFQNRRIPANIAIPALARFGIISSGGGESNLATLANLYTEMRDLRTPESRVAMIKASPMIRQAAMEMAGLRPGQYKALESLVGASWGVADIDYAIDKAARRRELSGRLSGDVDTVNPLREPFKRRALDRFWSTGNIDVMRDWSAKVFNPINHVLGLQGTPTFETADLMKSLGPEPDRWRTSHPDLVNREYQFTTFSGLAEMMQMQASQMGGGFEEQNAENIQKTADNTALLVRQKYGSTDPNQPDNSMTFDHWQH